MAAWLEGPGQYAVGLSLWSGWSWDLVVESGQRDESRVGFINFNYKFTHKTFYNTASKLTQFQSNNSVMSYANPINIMNALNPLKYLSVQLLRFLLISVGLIAYWLSNA